MNDISPKVAWSAWISILASVYLRIFFGVDFTDEGQYVGQAYMLFIGGRLFETDLFVQQNTALLVAPFMKLYLLCVGSSEGIVLFVRHLYFALGIVCSSILFQALKLVLPLNWARVLSVGPLAFIPFSIPSISYNTIAYFVLGIATSAGFLCFRTRKTSWALVAGLAWAVACFAYPTMHPTALVSFGVLGRISQFRREWVRGFGLYLGLTVLALLSLWVFVGVDRLQDAYAYTSSFYAPNLLQKLAATGAFIHRLFPLPFFLFLVVISLVSAYFWGKAWVITALVAFLIGRWMGIANTSSSEAHILFSVLALCFPLSWLHARESAQRDFWILVGVPSFVAAGAFCLSSANILLNAALGGVYCIWVWSVLLAPSSNRFLYWGANAGLVTLAIFLSYQNIYRDAPLSSLTERVGTGPYAGLYTSKTRHEFIESLQGVLAKDTTSIFFFDAFPGGYLMSSAVPKTISLYAHPFPSAPNARALLSKYFASEDNKPEVVVELKTLTPKLLRGVADPIYSELLADAYKIEKDHPLFYIYRRLSKPQHQS